MSLMSFLQAFGGGAGGTEDEEIVVNAQQRKPPVVDTDPVIPVGNRSQLEETQDAAAKAPQRQGMFKTRGTFRDILGVLGDAFLVQSGNKAVYQPQRQREKISDALVGYDAADPVKAQAALQRAANIDPDTFLKLSDNYGDYQLKQAQTQGANTARQSMIDERNYKKNQDFGNYAARVLGKAGDDPARQAAAMRLLQKRAALNGVDLEEFGISVGMTPDDIAVMAGGDMTVNQQEVLKQRESQFTRAEAGRNRRDNPPAPRSAPQPTNAAMAAPLIRKLQNGGTLNARENEVLNRLGYTPDRGKKGSRFNVPAPPPGFKAPR